MSWTAGAFACGNSRGTGTLACDRRPRLCVPWASFVVTSSGFQFWHFRRFWQFWQSLCSPLPALSARLKRPPRHFLVFRCKQRRFLQSMLGPPLGDAWVTLAWPLGDPRVSQSQTQSQQSAEGRKITKNTKRNGFPLRILPSFPTAQGPASVPLKMTDRRQLYCSKKIANLALFRGVFSFPINLLSPAFLNAASPHSLASNQWRYQWL